RGRFLVNSEEGIGKKFPGFAWGNPPASASRGTPLWQGGLWAAPRFPPGNDTGQISGNREEGIGAGQALSVPRLTGRGKWDKIGENRTGVGSMDYKHIVFDVDGTLVDTEDTTIGSL